MDEDRRNKFLAKVNDELTRATHSWHLADLVPIRRALIDASTPEQLDAAVDMWLSWNEMFTRTTPTPEEVLARLDRMTARRRREGNFDVMDSGDGR